MRCKCFLISIWNAILCEMPKRLDASILVVRVLFSTYLINVVFGVILISWHAVSCHVIVTSLGFFFLFFMSHQFSFIRCCAICMLSWGRDFWLTNIMMQSSIFWQEDLSRSQWRCSWRGAYLLLEFLLACLFFHYKCFFYPPFSLLLKLKEAHFNVFNRSSRDMCSRLWVAATSKVFPWSKECWLPAVFVFCSTVVCKLHTCVTSFAVFGVVSVFLFNVMFGRWNWFK